MISPAFDLYLTVEQRELYGAHSRAGTRASRPGRSQRPSWARQPSTGEGTWGAWPAGATIRERGRRGYRAMPDPRGARTRVHRGRDRVRAPGPRRLSDPHGGKRQSSCERVDPAQWPRGECGRRLRADRAAAPAPTFQRSSLRAHRDGTGYRLTGEKLWISNAPDADIYTVFARTSDGSAPRAQRRSPSRATPKASPASHSTLLSPHAIGRLRFERRERRAPVSMLGAPGEGFRVAMRTLDLFRPSVGAFAIGMARAALDCRLRSRARRVRPSAGRSATTRAVSHRLAGRRRPRRGCARCSSTRRRRRTMLASRDPALAAMAKLLATEIAQEAVDIAVQVHGAAALEHGPPARAPLPGGPRPTDLRGRLRDPARDHRPFAVQIRRGPQGGRLDVDYGVFLPVSGAACTRDGSHARCPTPPSVSASRPCGRRTGSSSLGGSTPSTRTAGRTRSSSRPTSRSWSR